MIRLGAVKSIWRYPVKGMGGECLEVCVLGKNGFEGDRIFALRDTLRSEIQSCKFRPELLLCIAKLTEGPSTGQSIVEVTFPDGSMLTSDDQEIHSKLSELTGHASTLEKLRPASDSEFYRRYKTDDHSWLQELAATFERVEGEPLPDFSQITPSLKKYVSEPGTFFLVSPFHFVTTTSIDHLKNIHPEGNWNERRFRPNLVIEGVPELSGLVEKDWVGKQLRIGEVIVDCVDETPRCGAVTKPQAGLSRDTAILRTIVKVANQNVGAYGIIDAPGDVRVGDPFFLI